jgi:hypothetical protein
MNGLNVKYTELLSLRIEQPFYTNNYCKTYSIVPELNFVLIPTAECQLTMERLDYLPRPMNENAGITIFSRVLGKNAVGNNLLRFKPSMGHKLSFWIVLKNPSVINFNQLPVTADASKMFYFTNQVTDAGALRNNLHLTASAAGIDETADTVTKKDNAYQYHHGAIVLPATAVVKHVLTGIEIEPVSIINQSASSDLYFNLSAFPEGNCKLFINHIEEDAFYYMGTNAPQQVFGVIELVLSHALDANYRIAEPDKSIIAQRPLYTVRFINRPTFWRYSLQLHTNSPLFLEMNALSPAAKTDFINRLNIITNDPAITFSQTMASPDGTIFQFVSDTAIALQEKYFSASGVTKVPLNLTLKKFVGDPAEAAVRTDLQCPSTGLINASNSPDIFSDIFLTI